MSIAKKSLLLLLLLVNMYASFFKFNNLGFEMLQPEVNLIKHCANILSANLLKKPTSLSQLKLNLR